jgi:hypothetical protein
VSVDEFSFIKWRLKIQPEKSEKVVFSYVLGMWLWLRLKPICAEYPSDKKVDLIPQIM